MRFQFLLYCCLLSMWVSCDFGNTNIDPIRPTNAELKEILPTALTQTAYNLMSINGRVTGIVVQHFKGIDAQPESYTQYLIDERTLDPFWRTGLYAGAMKDCDLMIQKATTLNAPHYQGIAQILMAINLGMATACWGEVPFQTAFDGLNNLKPRYDTQEDIYAILQILLQKGIENLEKVPSDNALQDADLIFGGQASLWIATAKALQARYYLHLSKKHLNAAQKVLIAIQSGAFQYLNEQPNFPFGATINEAHPLPLYCFERPDQLVMSDYLLQWLNSIGDPRLERLALNNNDVPLIYHTDSTQLYWGQFDAPLPFISLTELKFIEAEAHLRLGAITTAEVVFKTAVEAHFQQLNIAASVYESFITTHIHFNNASTFNEQLECIIQQKHLALFGQNPIEAWTDFRRTGFPQLTPSTNANSSFNPSLIIPQRYLYPISERTANEANLNVAIERQGGHLLDIPLWIFE